MPTSVQLRSAGEQVLLQRPGWRISRLANVCHCQGTLAPGAPYGFGIDLAETLRRSIGGTSTSFIRERRASSVHAHATLALPPAVGTRDGFRLSLKLVTIFARPHRIFCVYDRFLNHLVCGAHGFDPRGHSPALTGPV